MTKISSLGYPRLGENREWKKLIEAYWAGNISQEDLFAQAKDLRTSFLTKQLEAGLDLIPVGDFSLYDHILDLSLQFNIIPERFRDLPLDIDLYFAVARGNKANVASALKKWFNTNYHYIVPEWTPTTTPKLTNTRLLDLYLEARELVGDKAKPIITGPITYVALSNGIADIKAAVDSLLPLYKQVFTELVAAGASYIQIDDPIFVTDESVDYLDLAKDVYAYFAHEVPAAKFIFQTYFEALISPDLAELPVAAFGLDLVHGLEENLASLIDGRFADKEVFAGVVDGRNIWSTDFTKASALLSDLQGRVKELVVQPSCSLLHVPVTTKNETDLDPVLLGGLSFADEKLVEIKLLAEKLDGQDNSAYDQHMAAFDALQAADFRHLDLEKIADIRTERASGHEVRKAIQQEKLGLPILPTTTIGSFPQSAEVRKTRLAWKRGEITNEAYEAFINAEIERWIRIQEDLDIDVLVHGEFERVDMVEFFGQKLAGFTTTKLGWVQSYGSRAVKPPIIYGDVKHIQPLTVKESAFAQSLTDRPVKGMLTGPITITNWSFERTDISRAELFNQIGLAIKDEIKLLEEAGIAIIQVDEAALREGLPLRKSKQQAYLDDSVNAFRIATSSVADSTQIHTHMCYSKFEEIIDSIRALDADVISIETSRSHGDIIEVFETAVYPLGIGLGVYDIHSPRVPTQEEVVANIKRPLQQLSTDQFWVNPDCGLKTRGEVETVAALEVLVAATKAVRQELEG